MKQNDIAVHQMMYIKDKVRLKYTMTFKVEGEEDKDIHQYTPGYKEAVLTECHIHFITDEDGSTKLIRNFIDSVEGYNNSIGRCDYRIDNADFHANPMRREYVVKYLDGYIPLDLLIKMKPYIKDIVLVHTDFTDDFFGLTNNVGGGSITRNRYGRSLFNFHNPIQGSEETLAYRHNMKDYIPEIFHDRYCRNRLLAGFNGAPKNADAIHLNPLDTLD